MSKPGDWIKKHILVYTALVLMAGLLLGAIAQRFVPLGQTLRNAGLLPAPVMTPTATPRLDERVEVPLRALPRGRVMVALVLGQSNSANFGETPGTSGDRVLNFYQGRLYRARDPLLGANGQGGSVWTRLGDKLLATGQWDAVVFAPLGIGSTSVARWKPGGDMHVRLLETIRQLKAIPLTVTHMLWHQGETDAGLRTSQSDYQSMFLDMLAGVRKEGVDAPVYVSVATWCGKMRSNPEIQQAQRGLADPTQAIYAGPDTDSLGFAFRFDGCHFTDEGLERIAEMWLRALAP